MHKWRLYLVTFVGAAKLLNCRPEILMSAVLLAEMVLVLAKSLSWWLRRPNRSVGALVWHLKSAAAIEFNHPDFLAAIEPIIS
jgi:hypothetical protein